MSQTPIPFGAGALAAGATGDPTRDAARDAAGDAAESAGGSWNPWETSAPAPGLYRIAGDGTTDSQGATGEANGQGDERPSSQAPVISSGSSNLPVRRPGELTATEADQIEAHRQRASDEGWAFVDLSVEGLEIPADAISKMRGSDARRLTALPVEFREDRNQITVAVADPSDAGLSDSLRNSLAGMTVRTAYADPAAIRRMIERVYAARDEATALSQETTKRGALGKRAVANIEDLGRIRDSEGSEAVKLLNLIIEEALRNKASDIHLEPTEHALLARIRVNGNLIEIGNYPKGFTQSLMNKIKVEADMNVGNFLVPDSGGMTFHDGGKPVDIRVEVTPTVWGPCAVMRLQQNIWRPLAEIGFSPRNESRYASILEQSYGLILVCGPTGSGKALHVDTPIATPDGWTTMGALKDGDRVFGSDGKPCTVLTAWPINQTPELYRVTLDDGQTLIADRDHQWLVYDQQRSPSTKLPGSAAEALEARASALGSLGPSAGDPIVDSAHLIAVVGDLDLLHYFPSEESIEAALAAVDCPREAIGWPETVALKSLGARLRERYLGSAVSPFLARLTTAEIAALPRTEHGLASLQLTAPVSFADDREQADRLARMTRDFAPGRHQSGDPVQRTFDSPEDAAAALSNVRSLGHKGVRVDDTTVRVVSAEWAVQTQEARLSLSPDRIGAGRLHITSIAPVTPDDPDYGPARCITVDSHDRSFLCGDGYVVTSNTTLLYSSVESKIDVTTKIITLEDPVEYKVPKGVTQIPVKKGQGLDFFDGVRSSLRMDPDVVLVGEMRDQTTAEAAIDAAMTGHLVFSTLHTNDAPEAIMRVTRLGIEPSTLSGSLLGVIGQRLAGRLCETCKRPVTYTSQEIHDLGFDPDTVGGAQLFEENPDGCNADNCRNGFTGRIPVQEIMLATTKVRDVIARDGTQSELRDAAREGGMTTMREDAWERILLGQTSMREVNKRVRREF